MPNKKVEQGISRNGVGKGIPVEYAINSGCYFLCKTSVKQESGDDTQFRMKVKRLEKVDLKEVDRVAQIDKKYDLKQGDFWMLGIDAISLNKKSVWGSYLTSFLKLIDQDGYEFECTFDYHLCSVSDYGPRNGLNVFFLLFSMIPKIKYSGAIPYYLPKEDNARYNLVLEQGSITEI